MLFAQAGHFDSSFSSDGFLITTVKNSKYAYGHSVAIQTDKKIVVGGYYTGNSGDNDFLVVRYSNTGTLDNSFAGNGKAGIGFGGDDKGFSIAIQADGKIVAAGLSNDQVAVARLNTNGTLDNTFSIDGKVTTPVGSHAEARAVAIQPDGKIVVAGYYTNGSDDDFLVVRYNSNGTLDNSFAGDGIAGIGFGGIDIAEDLAIQPDGKIVVTGSTESSKNLIAVIRLNSNGTLDNTFSSDGKVKTTIKNVAVANSIAIQTDGKIIVAGDYVNTSGIDMVVVRYKSNGALDNSFAGNGKASIDFGNNDFGNSVAIQSDGKIVVVGETEIADYNSKFAIARLNKNGTLDNSFGVTGKVQASIDGIADYGNSVAIQPDGNIVVAGTSDINLDHNTAIAVARFQATNPPQAIETNENNLITTAGNKLPTLKIFPNPVKDKLNVQGLDVSKTKTISIIDFNGRILTTTTVTSSTYTWDVSALPPGIYYLQIDDKKNKGLKFMKE